MTHRLPRVCATFLRSQRLSTKHLDARKAPRHGLRNFSTAHHGSDGNDGGPDAPAPPGLAHSRLSRGASVIRRRRPLSPLERVSQLLPQDSLSVEVLELRKSPDEVETEEQPQNTPAVGVDHLDMHSSSDDAAQGQEGVVTQGSESEGKERMMQFGEDLIADYRQNRRTEFQKMFKLQKVKMLQTTRGYVPHHIIAGQPSGIVLHTSMGLPMLIRRPNLEEFTLFMNRGAAITYPKDVSAMLMMMDVNEGDSVLETGSGSGAMSLFLSRAVGSRGRVMSFEMREDHHRRAVSNYQRWRSTWKLRRGEEWPDNVHFFPCDLNNSAHLLSGQNFDSVALDMVSPHLALPTVIPHLHNGAVCAVYLANITQIIELMEGLRCSKLPLVCEQIIEVQHRHWLVAPSRQKDGTFTQRQHLSEEYSESVEVENSSKEKEELVSSRQTPFGSVPYIARPHHEQFGHTAFLMKLRKILK